MIVPTIVGILSVRWIFEWCEAKRIAALEARGLDFIDAEIVCDSRPLYTVSSQRGTEERWLSVGELNGRLVAVV